MKLKEYFDKKREITVSGGDKLEIYQKFISKKNTKSFQPQRQFFFIKSFAYSLVLGFLLLGLYGTYVFNGKFIINKDGFFIQRSNGIKSVQADYVAKIIEFNGNFYIGHNGQYYQGSYIANGDIVTLQEGAELLFHIDQGTQAKVIGPAKFLINKSNNGYKLNLSYGDFIELKTLESQAPQDIEISTQNLTIKQSDKSKPISFQLIKEGEKTLLKNNGPQLIITQNTTDKTQIQELNSDKILSIQANDISIIDDEKLAQAIIQKNFTQTLSFNDKTDSVDNLDDILNKEYTQETQAEKQLNQNIGLPNDKQIPTEDQMSKLISNLSESAISRNITNIKNTYPQDGNMFDGEFTKLENKIKQICSTFNINYTKVVGPSPQEKLYQLKNNIDSLSINLQEKYHIPPTYINKLQNTSSQISEILN